MENEEKPKMSIPFLEVPGELDSHKILTVL